MTKEETAECIKVMQAYIDGKIIQSRMGTDEWRCCTPAWNWVSKDYRIVPEPKYRPFKNADEAFNEAKKHGFWCCINKDEYRLVSFIDNTFIELANKIVQHYDFRQFLDFHWADTGEPCGILEE